MEEFLLWDKREPQRLHRYSADITICGTAALFALQWNVMYNEELVPSVLEEVTTFAFMDDLALVITVDE